MVKLNSGLPQRLLQQNSDCKMLRLKSKRKLLKLSKLSFNVLYRRSRRLGSLRKERLQELRHSWKHAPAVRWRRLNVREQKLNVSKNGLPKSLLNSKLESRERFSSKNEPQNASV